MYRGEKTLCAKVAPESNESQLCRAWPRTFNLEVLDTRGAQDHYKLQTAVSMEERENLPRSMISTRIASTDDFDPRFQSRTAACWRKVQTRAATGNVEIDDNRRP
jgi:hypothetical protein